MKKQLASAMASLAIMATLAAPAFAQTGSLTINIDCGNPESITVRNNTDTQFTLEGVNSSVAREGNPEINFRNRAIAAGQTVTIPFGSVGGGGNIFENGQQETATVIFAGNSYSLQCNSADRASRTIRFGSAATPTPTTAPSATATPSPTTTTLAPTATATTQQPQMPQTGGGGMAPTPGLPWGNIAGFGSLLLGGAYALVRRRRM